MLALGLSLRSKRWDGEVGLVDNPCPAAAADDPGIAGHDWPQLCRYRADNRRLLARGARPDVVMIGDSITANWHEAEPQRFDDRIVNRGIGRQTTQQLLLRFPDDVLALKPRVVHILGGTNDALGVHGPTTLDNVAANIDAMVALARAHGIVPVLATETFNPTYRRAQGSNVVKIGKVNAWLRDYANAHHIPLADYEAVLRRADNPARPLLWDDGIHPTREAYRLMDAELERALAEALSPLPS